MKPLRDWSGRRVVTLALAWVIGVPLLTAPAVFGAVAWLARAERARPNVVVPDSIAPALRVAYQPDPLELVQSMSRPGAALLAGLVFLPALALWVAWIIERRRAFSSQA